MGGHWRGHGWAPAFLAWGRTLLGVDIVKRPDEGKVPRVGWFVAGAAECGAGKMVPSVHKHSRRFAFAPSRHTLRHHAEPSTCPFHLAAPSTCPSLRSNIAFVKDPDGYWIEILTASGGCSNAANDCNAALCLAAAGIAATRCEMGRVDSSCLPQAATPIQPLYPT